jgi:hypothetical protein
MGWAMQIEEGRRYQTRSGQITGEMRLCNCGCKLLAAKAIHNGVEQFWYWHPSGIFDSFVSDQSHPMHIVGASEFILADTPDYSAAVDLAWEKFKP